MWWRFSEDFLHNSLVSAINGKCGPQNVQFGTYMIKALTAITESLRHPVVPPAGKRSVAWEAMLEVGVMRAVPGGYSAVAWLTENGLYGGPDVVTSQKSRKGKGGAQKIAVRENVKLTQGELDALKRDHGDRLERILDKLSEYKRTSGKAYASDYRAILSWVVQAVEQETPKPEPKPVARRAPRPAPEPEPLCTPEEQAANMKRLSELLKKL